LNYGKVINAAAIESANSDYHWEDRTDWVKECYPAIDEDGFEIDGE
jgi:hypothetical protein